MDAGAVKEWAAGRGYVIDDGETVTGVEIDAAEVTTGCCELCSWTTVETEVTISVEKVDGSTRKVYVTLGWDEIVSMVRF